MGLTQQWLLLMHQIPPKPDSLRVRVWRALQRLGALQLKNSVYVLPAGKRNEEKFESVLQEIVSGGGDAFLCQAQFVQGIENREIIDLFNADRGDRYRRIAAELRQTRKLIGKSKPSEADLMGVEHSTGKLERQLNELREIDFFACNERQPAFNLLAGILARIGDLRAGAARSVAKCNPAKYQGRTWVTRKDIHVDRVASAWLISTYIDRKATFKFVSEDGYRPKKNELRFDMFDGEFTHVGDKCTFEVLREAFSLNAKGLAAIAEIIHDLDLEDTKYNRPETAGIGMVIRSVVQSEKSDEARIKKAAVIFDDLVESLHASRTKVPRERIATFDQMK